jgi:hypothetical protein
VGKRTKADDRPTRLSSDEELHGWDRENLVARGDLRVFVDVQADDRHPALQLLEDRLERAAGAAPRGPEIDGYRLTSDGLVERRRVELLHSSRSVAGLQASS